jgi:hypothetical protein
VISRASALACGLISPCPAAEQVYTPVRAPARRRRPRAAGDAAAWSALAQRLLGLAHDQLDAAFLGLEDPALAAAARCAARGGRCMASSDGVGRGTPRWRKIGRTYCCHEDWNRRVSSNTERHKHNSLKPAAMCMPGAFLLRALHGSRTRHSHHVCTDERLPCEAAYTVLPLIGSSVKSPWQHRGLGGRAGA